MDGVRLATAVAVIALLGGCGSEEPDIVMPDVVGQRLDVAVSDIERAGFDDEVEIVGGGTFGIVDESNWQVCGQLPAAGEPMTSEPRIEVDRSCDDDTDADLSSTASEFALSDPTPNGETPAGEESVEASPQAREPSASASPDDQLLTVETSNEFAELLAGSDECDRAEQFTTQNEGRAIAFDGYIADMVNHEGYDTRYDMLILAGDYEQDRRPGPSFQFYDVNTFDLGLTGPNVPDVIREGDNLRVTATVEEFTQGCLLRLDPISTEIR